MCRTEKKVNWHEVDQYLEAGCLGTEIAAFFNMHPKTFYAKVEEKYKITFTEYSTEKKNKGDSLLRKRQFDKALEGDNGMLIWLGKNRLKQSESPLDQKVTEETKEQFSRLMSQLSSMQSDRTNACKTKSSERKS